jgi:drug/metabolite transporter (DMT)-like permease
VKPKHWFVFILLGAIWGSSFFWIKIAVQEISPNTLVAFRALFGLLFGLVVMTIQGVHWPRSFTTWFPLLVLGITNIAVPFFLISWGERSIDSGVASILDATVPLFTIVIAHLALRDDKITLPKLLGLLTGFIGVVVLMSKDFGASPSSILGQVAVIVASAFYAGSAVYVRKFTEDTPGILRSAVPLLSAAVVMWLATLVTEQPVGVPHLGITWAALLWLGILGSGLAFMLAFYLVHEIGPTRMSMVSYLFPLGGVILGVTFLHEPLTWQLITGGVLIIASLAIANGQPTNAAGQASSAAHVLDERTKGPTRLA